MLFAAAGAAACNPDPVHDAQVKALGPEAPGVPQGECHRAGQPCNVCHGGSGPASAEFRIAGTIFYGPGSLVGVDQATVVFVDSNQSKFQTTTNCVGNFVVMPGEWDPAFPILVTVAGQGLQQSMQSQISRDTSCAGCHAEQTDFNYFQSPGHVHLAASDGTYAGTQTCPVNPVAPGLGGP
jgi:hypothetical protein